MSQDLNAVECTMLTVKLHPNDVDSGYEGNFLHFQSEAVNVLLVDFNPALFIVSTTCVMKQRVTIAILKTTPQRKSSRNLIN